MPKLALPYTARRATRTTPVPSEPASFAEARQQASLELATLEKEIPQLTIVVEGSSETTITVDGESWPAGEAALTSGCTSLWIPPRRIGGAGWVCAS